MSDSLRIAIVCEGPTDKIIFDDLLEEFLGHANFRSTLVQPIMSALGGDFGPFGGGWQGVLRWCAQVVSGGMSFDMSITSTNNDLIIVHVDADVARETSLAHLHLPSPCPPAKGTCDNLRKHLAALLGGPSLPGHLVFCVPADSTEAWVIAALNPAIAALNSPWECFRKPEDRLTNVTVEGKTVGKSQRSYARIASYVSEAWYSAKSHCPEASRFESDLRLALKI
jgi:hypothetical protein